MTEIQTPMAAEAARNKRNPGRGETGNSPSAGTTKAAKMATRDVHVHYGTAHALQGISLDVGVNEVTALIGPSGCGKSTFLRCLHRMNDVIEGCKIQGKVTLDDFDIYDPSLDVVQLRARVGMVFQKPNPFPKSIYDNVAYGPRIHGVANTKDEL